MNPLNAPESSEPFPPLPPVLPSPPRRLNWVLFFVALLGPTLLTIVVTLLGSTRGDTVPTIAFVGGVISGIACGVLLGRRLGSTPGSRVVIGFAFTVAIGAACIVMNCFGCLASGYQFTM